MGSGSHIDAGIVRWQCPLRTSQHIDITTSQPCCRLVGADWQFDGVAGFAGLKHFLAYAKG